MLKKDRSSKKMSEQGNGTAVLVHAMKVYKWNRGIAPLVLNLGARWRRVVNITPRPIHCRNHYCNDKIKEVIILQPLIFTYLLTSLLRGAEFIFRK